MVMLEKIHAAEDGQSSVATAELTELNSVMVSVGQLSAARQILGELADGSRWDIVARRSALRAELDERDSVIAAIDARLLAVRKWEDIHDPDRVMSQLHLMEAATLVTLLETEHGIGFRDTTFRELVDFIAEFPW